MTSIFDETAAGFDAVDQAAATDTFAGYLDGVADRLAAVKAGLHDLLGAGPGARVLDVGCGTGVDVLALARRVGRTGRVAGLDNSQALVDAAVEHAAGTGLPVEFRCGDAHELPYPDDAFDAVRCERVMMHLADPERAARELLRVTRPGGRVLVADPDHGMWALDAADIPLTRTVLTWWFDNIANPWAARRSPALLRRNGLAGLQVRQLPITLLDLGAAAAITGVARAAGAAAGAGVITAEQRDRFDADLAAAEREGRFLLCGSMVVSTGTAPGSAG